MIYLDANATEPLRPSARAALIAALGRGGGDAGGNMLGNPYSVHAAGRAARRILEDAREQLAARFGARPADVVFTSGATEADALALYALGANRRLIVGATEHDAVLSPATLSSSKGATLLPVDHEGIADLAALEVLLASGAPALVCLMAANNETGAIQPIAEAATICHRHGALLHVDAVQAAGRMAFSLAASGADSAAISSHKMGGPAGVGALLLAPTHTALSPLISGGGQERGRRGGTPAVAICAGFAAAALVAGDASALAPLRDAAERTAVAHGAVIVGGRVPRLPNTTCLALPGVRADAQVIALDLAGVCVSAGAACAAGKISSSHVLAAMGLGELAEQAIRVSFPWNAHAEHVEGFARAYANMAAALGKTLSGVAA
ncbi:MAG: aminotransferase class V-fold PLP-dependent enzyme [Acetobacteraceae bacterium]|nr:aminotransferase class V-fold PLP-dependent enzyme [Acetobacteraceae bacterium]